MTAPDDPAGRDGSDPSARDPAGDGRVLPTDDTVRLDRVRRTALAALAHELRTPLSLVTGPLGLLERSDELSDDDRRHVATAVDGAGRLAAQFERLLTVASWPDEGTRRPVDVVSLLRETAVEVLRQDPEGRHDAVPGAPPGAEPPLRVAVAAPDDPPVVHLHLPSARWAIQVVLEEVLGDVGPDGELDIEVSRTDDGRVRARVVWSSGGTDGDPDRVRVDGPLRAAARESLAAQGLEVTVATDADRSGGFVLSTVSDGGDGAATADPSAVTSHDDRSPRSTALADPAVSSTPDASGPLTVLLVEDDDALREFLVHSLAPEYRMLATDTAEEALDIAAEQRLDLVVCDIVLPGIGGEELVRTFERLSDLAEVPIIVLTGRTDEQLRVRLLQDGADDYLTKPFVLDELRVRIANLVAQRHNADELRGDIEHAEQLAGQLRHALGSRVVIEQAKGFVAADRGVGVDEAFALLRSFARSRSRRLHDVAQAVVERRLHL